MRLVTMVTYDTPRSNVRHAHNRDRTIVRPQGQRGLLLRFDGPARTNHWALVTDSSSDLEADQVDIRWNRKGDKHYSTGELSDFVTRAA